MNDFVPMYTKTATSFPATLICITTTFFSRNKIIIIAIFLIHVCNKCSVY